MIQQAVVLLIVCISIFYVGRYLWNSLKEIWQAKKGCGGGCANCAFAPLGDKPNRKSAAKPTNIISLTPIDRK